MQNTGQVSERKSYRVLLLLVVGLAAFSSAMKELNEVHALTLETSSLLAQWSDKLVPGDMIKVETCQNQVPVLPPPPPMPAVPAVPAVPPPAPEAVGDEADDPSLPVPAVPEVAPLPPAPPRVREVPAPKPRRWVVQPVHDSAQVRVLLPTEEFIQKSIKDAFASDPSLKTLKAKNRRQIFITSDGKDVILKTLNRSISLRSAS